MKNKLLHLSIVQLCQAIKGLLLLGEDYIVIERKEKDCYAITTKRSSQNHQV